MKRSRTRRKRTNSSVPAKGRLREMADRLWSLAVRDDWGNRCAICGARPCEAHHMVPRQHEATRYDLRNGIALCPRHHKFCKDMAPHLNGEGFRQWLSVHHPARLEWLEENCRPEFHGTKNADYYCNVIRSLKEYVDDDDFESICGIKFSRWLEENDHESTS